MVNIGNVNNSGSERRGLSFLVFIGIIGFSVARGIATFFTNYLWFDSVNLNEVWVKILLTRLGLVGATTTIAFAFIFINCFLLHHHHHAILFGTNTQGAANSMKL